MARFIYINPDEATGKPRATALGCGWMPATPPEFVQVVASRVPCAIVSGAGTTTILPEPTTAAAVASAAAPILAAEQAANAAAALEAATWAQAFIGVGLLAARPPSPQRGYQWFATDDNGGRWSVYDGSAWVTGAAVLPKGGASGQTLVKTAGTDFAAAWADRVLGGQPALADLADFQIVPGLSLGVITSLVSAVNALRADNNALKARLRSAGVIL